MKLLKTLKLGFIDESLAEAYVRFKPFSFDDAEKYADVIDGIDLNGTKRSQIDQARKVQPLIEALFVDGRVPDDDGQLRDMTAEDLKDMPLEFFLGAGRFLNGQIV